MSLTKCPYCEHGNPGSSKFCNACGATLTLAPCPHCGAVNQVSATSCYQCKGQLPAAIAEAPALPAPAAIGSTRSALRLPGMVLGVVMVAAVAASGYYAYRPRPLIDAPAPAAANSEPGVRAGPIDAGAVARDTAAGKSEPAKSESAAAENATIPESVVAPPSEAAPVPASPSIPSTNQPRAGRQTVESAQTPAATAAGARAPASGRAGALEAPRLGPCTERVAALGLCTLKPVPVREAETNSAAAAVRTQGARAGEAGEGPCTDAVAALGLCTRKPIQKRE